MPTLSATPLSEGHGDVFARNLGSMIIHVQREIGLAHRTIVLRPWQVRFFRVVMHRGTRIVVAFVVLSWAYLAYQAVRVPVLTTRLARMERDALRLDTLEATLKELQARYDQVQAMLSVPAKPSGTRP